LDIYDFHAQNHSEKIAAVEGGRRISWEEFAQTCRKAANAAMSLGLRPGARTLFFSGNSVDAIIAGAGVRTIGGVVVPVNSYLTAPELEYIIGDCAPAMIVADREHLEVLKSAALSSVENVIVTGGEPDVSSISRAKVSGFGPLVEGADDAEPGAEGGWMGSYIMYTSGTTGRPKGAMHERSPDASVAFNYVSAFGLAPDDIHLVAGPLYHSAPAAFCTITLSAGATIVVMGRFDAEEALRLIEAERVTTTFMAPTLLQRIVNLGEDVHERYDLSSMRGIFVGGAPCPFPLKVAVHKLFGPVLYEFYGSTETKAALYLNPGEQLKKPGSCGRPFPGVEVKLVAVGGGEPPTGEPGEIWVRENSASFSEYYKDPEKTAATIHDGWIATGDVAYRDPGGYYYICDRKTDMVISGGVNIYPAEVEAALIDHPAVADAAVFGIPDEEWGEKLHAVIETSQPGVTGSELEDFLRRRLAGFKVPRSWEFVNSLGRTEDGKLRKHALRATHWESAGRRV
jgi:acyl-CoA synthetase (AMP-forming)/AMP-acid ligase II